jgi:hypothetical protein
MSSTLSYIYWHEAPSVKCLKIKAPCFLQTICEVASQTIPREEQQANNASNHGFLNKCG